MWKKKKDDSKGEKPLFFMKYRQVPPQNGVRGFRFNSEELRRPSKLLWNLSYFISSTSGKTDVDY